MHAKAGAMLKMKPVPYAKPVQAAKAGHASTAKTGASSILLKLEPVPHWSQYQATYFTFTRGPINYESDGKVNNHCETGMHLHASFI